MTWCTSKKPNNNDNLSNRLCDAQFVYGSILLPQTTGQQSTWGRSLRFDTPSSVQAYRGGRIAHGGPASCSGRRTRSYEIVLRRHMFLNTIKM